MLRNCCGSARAESPVHGALWIMLAVLFLGFHTFLFSHVSQRLDKALKRVDKLELLLIKIVSSDDDHTKSLALAELRHIRSDGSSTRLGSDFGQTGAARGTVLRSRRSNSNAEFQHHTGSPATGFSIRRRIARVERKVKKCLDGIRRMKEKTLNRRRFARSNQDNYNNHETKPEPCCTNTKEPTEPTRALFTVWGANKCIRKSTFVLKGQVVLVDGSDFHCLPDMDPGIPLNGHKAPDNDRRRSNIRGVTYGPESQSIFLSFYPILNRKNRTVPCMICSREEKTGSAMLLGKATGDPYFAMPSEHTAQYEYYGVLMTAKNAKQSICLSNDGNLYNATKERASGRDGVPPHPRPWDTAQLEPADIDCDTVRCHANPYYQKRARIGCMVMTF